MTRTRTIALATIISLTGCSGVLAFLGAHAQDIAAAVLECVPVAVDPSPEAAANCLAATIDAAVPESSGPTRGETVIECAHSIREAQAQRDAGEDSTEAEARARALIDQLGG